MPDIRERNPGDKIKNKSKGSRQVKKDARRQLTAKFRKELAQRKREGDHETPETQAVEQAGQTAAAAVEETTERAGQGISKAITTYQKSKAQRKRKAERQRQTGGDHSTPNHAPTTGTIPAQYPLPAEDSSQTPGVPPTPQERMRQKLVEERREQARRTEGSTLPQGNELAGHSPHYGGSYPAPEKPKENRSLENQSIHPSIKERPRRSANPKEKPSGGAFVPKTRQQVEQGAKKAANIQKATTGKATASKSLMERARRKFQREAQRKMIQKSQQTARTAADLTKKAALATAKAVKAIVSALAGLMGAGVLVAALSVVILIAAVIASPFGILFANEPSTDAVSLNAAAAQISMELTDKLADLQAGDYDSITIQGQPPDWRDVVAVFASKTAGAEDGVDVAALTPDRVERLRTVYWDMCAISAATETVDHPATDTTEAWTETLLTITITAKTAEEMRTQYAFSALQNDALTELLAELDTLDTLLRDLSVSQMEALQLLQNLPDDLSPERRTVVETACRLVGKVNYFWGGKSLVIGWDSRWGTLQKVTAEDSPTTGTYRPYGMDCSGFADWVFYNASGGAYIIGHGGGAAMQHTYCTAIQWDEAQPGDLVFYPDDEHVGIVGGRDEAGELLVIHCASGANNVVITGTDGFTMIGRPLYYGE